MMVSRLPQEHRISFANIYTFDCNSVSLDDDISSFSILLSDIMETGTGEVNSGPIPIRDSNSMRYRSVELFLTEVLTIISRKCNYLTCIIEPNHIDDVYQDLYAEHYSREFFETSRSTLRVSLFNDALTEEDFFNKNGQFEEWDHFKLRPEIGTSLSETFIGCIVLIPRAGGSVGRTLIDPKWLLADEADIRLSDYAVTIKGKRLKVSSFPYRQQDNEVLSCAEISILGLLCYYSNEYNEYSITMPRQVISELARSNSNRVTPSNGLNYDDVCRVLSKEGFYPRQYDVNLLGDDSIVGFNHNPQVRLRKVLRTYIDSGIPVAVNVQPGQGRPGHSLLVVGVSGKPQAYSNKDVQPDMWAERMEYDFNAQGHQPESPNEQEPLHKTSVVVDISEIERDRRFVVIDDEQLPFATQPWPKLSAFEEMNAVEMVVPLTRAMALDARDARDQAGEILRSKHHGFLAHCGDRYGKGETLVLVQQMVSVRSYMRFRIATCEHELSPFYGSGPFPRFSWLFELLEIGQLQKNPAEREAVAEILLDATSVSAGDPLQRLVLLRYPKLFHIHLPNGEHWTSFKMDIPASFPAYCRNLRHVVPQPSKRQG